MAISSFELLWKPVSTSCMHRLCVHTTIHCVHLNHLVQNSNSDFEPWLQRQHSDTSMSCSALLTCVTGQKCCNIIHLSFTTPTLQHTIAAGDARTLPKSDTNHLDITKTPSTPRLWGLSQLFILSLTAHHQHHQFNHTPLCLCTLQPPNRKVLSQTPRPSPHIPNTTTRCSKKNAVRALSVCVAREKGHSSTLLREYSTAQLDNTTLP
jgi:hypothetical protein